MHRLRPLPEVVNAASAHQHIAIRVGLWRPDRAQADVYDANRKCIRAGVLGDM